MCLPSITSQHERGSDRNEQSSYGAFKLRRGTEKCNIVEKWNGIFAKWIQEFTHRWFSISVSGSLVPSRMDIARGSMREESLEKDRSNDH